MLGKLARHVFPLTDTVPGMAQAGTIFYLVGLILGLVLWSFAVLWFIIAVIMIATARSFPFNMGWWGFVFPIGELRCRLIIEEEVADASFRHLHVVDDFDRRRI